MVGGSTALEGRVEICDSQAWGTVCDDAWSSVDAGVACIQLGYQRTGKDDHDIPLCDCIYTILCLCLTKQEQLRFLMPSLAKALVESSSIIWAVLELRLD